MVDAGVVYLLVSDNNDNNDDNNNKIVWWPLASNSLRAHQRYLVLVLH